MSAPSPMELLAALDVLRRWVANGRDERQDAEAWIDAASAPVPQRTIREAVRRGELEASRAGGKLLVKSSELNRWIEERRVKPSTGQPSEALAKLGARRVA